MGSLPQGARQARAAARIALCLGSEHRVIQPGAALWAWPARSLRELPPQCPREVALCLQRALSAWRAGRAGRPCVICRRGHWLVAAWAAVEAVGVDAPCEGRVE